LVRDRQSFVHRIFAVGLLLLAVEEALRGLSFQAILPDDVLFWHKRILGVSALVGAVWIAFSVTYARADASKFLARWKWALIGAGAIPCLFIVAFRRSLVAGSFELVGPGRWFLPLAWPGQALALFVLVASVLILFNLERTIRSSTGRMRWQIKFLALGVGGLFALRVYLSSQALLFFPHRYGSGLRVRSCASRGEPSLHALSAAGRSLSVDVYLSTDAIRNSLTIVLAGIYLLAVGCLAYTVRYFNPNRSLPLDAFAVFLSLTVLGVLLLSNRCGGG
jgi:hypothetical protein